VKRTALTATAAAAALLPLALASPAWGAESETIRLGALNSSNASGTAERFPKASASGEVSYERTFDLSAVPGGIELQNVSIVQHAPANCGSVAGAPVSTGASGPGPDADQPDAGRWSVRSWAPRSRSA
jgi:hypothetical protein